jgi:hypothetical protein
MKYAMVVSNKGHNKKSPYDYITPFKSYAIERLRNEEDLEKRARGVRNAGGQVIAIGLEDDRQYEQRARLAVVQLTNGSWSVERAREYLVEHLRLHCHDPYLLRMNRLQDSPPAD